jgi:prepilin-type N-terminal cleavage/methylation domain-containing protein
MGRGYTLIELLIVVTMLGIASSVVLPSLGSTDVLRVQSTVRAIVADINVAQSEALAHQQTRALIFDVERNRYSLVEVPGATLDPASNTIYSVNLNDSRSFHNSVMVSANFDGDNVLLFDELGGPIADVGGSTPSSGGTIVVQGSGSVFNINVEAYTGRVTVTRVSGP